MWNGKLRNYKTFISIVSLELARNYSLKHHFILYIKKPCQLCIDEMFGCLISGLPVNKFILYLKL